MPTITRVALLAIAVAISGTARLAAQASFTWLGNGGTGSVTLNPNWSGGSHPQGDNVVTEDVVFGNPVGSQTNVLLPGSGFILHSLTFNGTSRPAYTFSGTGSPTFGLTGNITLSTAGGDVTFDNSFNVSLTSGTHTVSLSPAGTLMTVNSVVSGSGRIVKTGAGTLKLLAANSFTGGLTVNAGDIYLGTSTSAGTGTLTLANTTRLFGVGTLSLANTTALSSGNVDVDVGSRSDSLAFTGTISGSALLNYYGLGALSISGNNTGWSGGLKVWGDGTVNLNSPNSLGTGGLSFDSASDGIVNIYSSMAVKDLSSASNPSQVVLQGGSTLTVNVSTGATTFAGLLNENGGAGGLTKTGAGTLVLTNSNGYTGNTNVNAGTLVADGSSQNGQLGGSAGVVNINSGGKLEVRNTVLNNTTININSGGRLLGNAALTSWTFVNNGGILSPGVTGAAEIGTLGFRDLTLVGGGLLEWNLQNPNGPAGTGFDVVTIGNSSTLHIDSSTGTTPFTLKLISLDGSGAPGTATGFLNQSYTWTLINASSGTIVGYTGSSQFSIDASQFSTDAGLGTFSFANSGNQLQVTFTPVPEPSTCALIGAGLISVAVLRRKRTTRVAS